MKKNLPRSSTTVESNRASGRRRPAGGKGGKSRAQRPTVRKQKLRLCYDSKSGDAAGETMLTIERNDGSIDNAPSGEFPVNVVAFNGFDDEAVSMLLSKKEIAKVIAYLSKAIES